MNNIFLENKYTKWYYNIVDYRKKFPLLKNKEKHHIVPKSLGGDNSHSNLVNLSPREHFVCHLLLTKMLTSTNKKKMVHAFWRICNCKKYSINSRLYEKARIEHSICMAESKKGIKRKPFSDKWRENMSLSHIGKKVILTQKGLEGKRTGGEKRKGLEPWNKGKCAPYSEETLKKMSENFSLRMKGVKKKKVICKYCSMEVAPNILSRFHNENCKNIN
jgi:hypothetical protein